MNNQSKSDIMSNGFFSRLINDLKSIPSPVFYIFAAVAVFSGLFVLGFNTHGIITSIFFVLLVACAAADINKGIIPDFILILIVLLSVIHYLLLVGVSVNSLVEHLTGAVCISVPMLIITLIVNKAFGGGDIKLMAAAGLYLGWHLTLGGAVTGLFTAGLYGFYLILARKAKLKSKVKLAPFLVYGLAIFTLFGEQIVNTIIILPQFY